MTRLCPECSCDLDRPHEGCPQRHRDADPEAHHPLRRSFVDALRERARLHPESLSAGDREALASLEREAGKERAA